LDGLKAHGTLAKKNAAQMDGVLEQSKRCNSALAELGSATSGLQTVLLLLAEPKTLDIQGFLASLSDFNP